jgi:hypothetical protein
MTVDRYFKLSSYLMFATGFVMLVATRQLDWLASVLFAVVLVIGWLVDSGRLRWRIPQSLITWSIILYVPFAAIGWAVLGFSPAVTLIYSILFVSSFKLLQPKQDRDWLWLYVVSFFEMLLAAGMTIDTTFFLLLIVFLFAGTSTLVSFEICRVQQSLSEGAVAIEFWKDRPESRRWLGPPSLGNLAGFCAVALLLIMLLAAPLFLAMPRLSQGLLGGGWLRGETLSGFSDSVRLGEVAQVKLNSQVVMRVRVQQPPEQYRAALRWRGVSFDHYDGRVWSDSRLKKVPVARDSYGAFRLSEEAAGKLVTRQIFYLEPLDINTIFVAPRPMSLLGLRSLLRDQGDGLWSIPHSFSRLIYLVESDTTEVRDTALREDNSRVYPAEIRARYLQLPEERDRRIDELAAEITRGAKTQIEITRRIEHHLQTQYSYTLNLRRTNNDDPVADFLFNVRAGHCEYFATAMTLMLRARGIPARLVNGFQMGEYSDVADIYTVRQSDAHSWVEVYFPKHKWVAFDPTPAAGLNVYEGGLLARLRHYGEAIELFWLEKVIGFDSSQQASIILSAQRWLSFYQREAALRWLDLKLNLAEWIESWRHSREAALEELRSPDFLPRLMLHPLALALYALMGFAGIALVWRKRARSWQRRIKRDAVASAVAFYQEMLVALERAGYRRQPAQTPQEFAETLGMPSVGEITRLYQQVRFGGRQLTEAEVRQVSRLLQELKKNGRAGAGMIEGAD